MGYFNSRPSARGDARDRQNRNITPSGFQFTPLREGRRGDIERRQNGNQFQFTPLREGRQKLQGAACRRTKFQFTPLREGRHDSPGDDGTCDFDFNSRPSARGDKFCLRFGSRTGYFNSRPSARGDRHIELLARFPRYFNSRPSARGDPVTRAKQRR